MASEADMLANELPLQADILKVAHHGSDTATSYDFVKAVSPAYAIVSCSSKEDLEYPDTDVAMTLMDCGVSDIITTEMHGDITFVIEDDGTIIPAWQR